MRKLPRRVAVIGGSYIGLEFGFFLSMMGSHVTIFDMLPRIAPGEEPEVSYLLELDMSSHMDVVPGHRVVEIRRRGEAKVVAAEGTEDHDSMEVEVDEIVVAAGRRSNSDLTKPEKTGVKTDANGWIVVNEYLETTKPNIWACGDALGRHMFKHVADYESQVVYYNAFRGQRVKADYHAVPHAIFVQPEVAAVGAREEDLRGKGGDYLVGYYMYKTPLRAGHEGRASLRQGYSGGGIGEAPGVPHNRAICVLHDTRGDRPHEHEGPVPDTGLQEHARAPGRQRGPGEGHVQPGPP
jgi:Pyruvate/2-oxoglutarate dehydrogenase complex, dihydrolipoamide dehydrogenase (E3) component, and related enzymes